MFTAAVAANGLGHPRLGVTVSRRVSLRATVRNRIKRVAREEFRALQQQLPAADIVLLAGKAAAETDAPALHLDLEQLFGRIRREYATAHPGR
jgi:ribonuclease P protein component